MSSRALTYDLALVVKRVPLTTTSDPLVLECIIAGQTTDLRGGQWTLRGSVMTKRLDGYTLVHTTTQSSTMHLYYIKAQRSTAPMLEVVRGLMGQGLLDRALCVLDGLNVDLSEAVYADDLRDTIQRRLAAEKRGYASSEASAPHPAHRQARI